MTKQLTKLQKEIRELWEADKEAERLRQRMKNWDKKLSHLDNEMLYYVFNRAASIIEYRTEEREL